MLQVHEDDLEDNSVHFQFIRWHNQNWTIYITDNTPISGNSRQQLPTRSAGHYWEKCPGMNLVSLKDLLVAVGVLKNKLHIMNKWQFLPHIKLQETLYSFYAILLKFMVYTNWEEKFTHNRIRCMNLNKCWGPDLSVSVITVSSR